MKVATIREWLCDSSLWYLYGFILFNHPSILSFILTSLKNWLKTPVSASNMYYQHLQQYVQIQAVALMTIILGCGAATIQGQLLTSQIQ